MGQKNVLERIEIKGISDLFEICSIAFHLCFIIIKSFLPSFVH